MARPRRIQQSRIATAPAPAAAPAVVSRHPRRPKGLDETEQAWIGEREPEGTATAPKGMPPAGFKPGMNYNRAGRWLENRGWYSLHSLAALLNVKRLSLKRRCLKGQIPYLRVGARSWWVPPHAIAKVFEAYGDPPAYRAWVAAKKPLRPGRKH